MNCGGIDAGGDDWRVGEHLRAVRVDPAAVVHNGEQLELCGAASRAQHGVAESGSTNGARAAHQGDLGGALDHSKLVDGLSENDRSFSDQ